MGPYRGVLDLTARSLPGDLYGGLCSPSGKHRFGQCEGTAL